MIDIPTARNWLVTNNRNNTCGELPTSQTGIGGRAEILTLSAVDTALFAASGATAGTPAGPWVGGLTLGYGGARLVRAGLMCSSPFGSDCSPGKQEAKAAVALIAAGATACFAPPIIGKIVCYKLALWSGLETAAIYATPVSEPKRVYG